MKTNFFILFLFASSFLFTPLLAQSLFYEISKQEYIDLKKGAIVAKAHLHTPLDDKTDPYDDLGYFIKVYPKGEKLQLNIWANTTLSLKILPHPKDLLLKVLDTLGQPITYADVYLGTQKILYHKGLNAFRLKNWKPKEAQTIFIETASAAIFYDLDAESYPQKNKTNFAQFFHKFKYRFPRFFRRTWHRIKQGKPTNYNGYMVSNQPKFRPNDTLKVKGYFLERKNKPINSPLQLQLLDGYQVKWTKTIHPIEKGSFVAAIPLSDSLNLKLDKKYKVVFKKEESTIKALDFQYEDYQLDEVRYALISDTSSYQHGAKIKLKLDGKLTTGHRIADGTVHIIARINPKSTFKPQQFFDKKVEVSDTLWQIKQPLHPDEPTQVLIPTDSFPKVATPIHIDAIFSNSNGEIQEKKLTLQLTRNDVKRKVSQVQLRLEGAYIIADYAQKEARQKSKIEWTMEYDEELDDLEKFITLPHKERINPFALEYRIYLDKKYESLVLADFSPEVQLKGVPSGNKLHLSLSNPRQLSIYYQLYKGQKLLTNKHTNQEAFFKTIPINPRTPYTLKYQFHWGGETITKEVTFTPKHQQLNIAIEQPTHILPGATIPLKIKVKNANGQQVKGVNLTAGAINKQFEKTTTYSDLQVFIKKSKALPYWKVNHYWQEPEVYLSNKLNKTWALNKDWLIQTNNEQKLYYQLRYPEKGAYLQYDTIQHPDTFYQQIAQFAPIIVKEGIQQPIYLIYCNGQLVYYYDLDKQMPYAFIGKEGMNQIVIRTKNHRYETMVKLEKGKKLIFSIDEKKYTHSKNPLNLTRRYAYDKFSHQEKKLIKDQIFVLKPQNGDYLLYQGDTIIRQIPNQWRAANAILKLGPFQSQKEIQCTLKNKFKKTVSIEPGYSQLLTKNKDYYYEYKWTELNKPLPHKIHLPTIKDLKDLVYTPTIKNPLVKQSLPKRKWMIDFDSPTVPLDQPIGRLLFKINKPTKDIVTILWKPNANTTYAFAPKHRTLTDKVGAYELVILYKDSSYVNTHLALKNNKLLFLDLADTPIKRDSFFHYFNQIRKMPKLSVTVTGSPIKYKAAKNRTTSRSSINTAFMPSQHTVSGVITDDTGAPLIGASVLVKGTTMGTVTDLDGSYSLNVPANAQLIVSYTGYATQEVTLSTGQSLIDIQLSEGLELSEVVVTGYSYGVESMASIAVLSSQKNAKGIETSLLNTEKDPPKIFNQKLAINTSSLFKDNPRKNFADHGFWMPNLTTDAHGEAYFMAKFPDNFTSWETYAVGMDKKNRVGVGFAMTNAFKPLIGQLSLPRFLVAGDSATIIGKALNFTKDSLTIQTAFKKDSHLLQTNTAPLVNTLIENIIIQAPTKTDSLTYIYQVNTEQYQDAEKRSIPVFKKGIEEHQGSFHSLTEDTTLQLNFEDTITPVTIRIESSIMDLLQGNLDYLIQYPHGCNEQTSSKLLATLLAKKLKEAKGGHFQALNYLNYGVNRLANSQNEDGSWGWWKGGKTDIWMTTYVLNALHEAALSGYTTPAFQKGINYLSENLDLQEGRQLLDILHFFSKIGFEGDYQKWLAKVAQTLPYPTLNTELTILKIKQAQDLPYDLTNLLQKKQQDNFKNAYWGNHQYHWYNTYVQNTLLAYQILRKAKKHELCESIERYLLRNKKRAGWVNTYQTAKVVSVILDYHLTSKNWSKEEKVTLAIGNQSLIKVQQFPFEKTIPANLPVKINKQSGGLLYCSTKQTSFNTQPQPKKEYFEINTSFIQSGKAVNKLKVGAPTELVVKVQVKKNAAYAMIAIPIPGGCSYGVKNLAKVNQEVHREYYKDQVAIFCESLPKGTYEYRINLEPRYVGKYTINPAKVEEMYTPIFYGRNEMKQVRIE